MPDARRCCFSLLALLGCLLLVGTPARAEPQTDIEYAKAGEHKIRSDRTLSLYDSTRNKLLKLRVTWPDAEGPFPAIIWSHGLGGSMTNYDPLVEHWASHGFVVIQPTHGDSIRAILRDGEFPDRDTMLLEWDQRPADVKLILDSFDDLVKRQPRLKNKIDRKRIGIGGHSFGAHTSMLLAGATVYPPGERDGVSFRDKRPTAFVMVSAQGTGMLLKRDSYQGIDRPTLFVTGSRDDTFVSRGDPQWRLEPFQFSPPGQRYLLFIEDGWHGFGGIAEDRIPYRGRGPDNPRHVAYVRAGSLAHWRAFLLDDEDAKAWLNEGKLTAASKREATLTRRTADTQDTKVPADSLPEPIRR